MRQKTQANPCPWIFLRSHAGCHYVIYFLFLGAVNDYEVTFAYTKFWVKDFPVSDFQHGIGYTESN